MNLPNKLTLTRIIAIPFFVFFLVYDDCFGLITNPNISRIIAAVLFILASVTDFLDGYLARSRNLITDFGKFMDPLADKFLILGAMFAICFSDYIFDYQEGFLVFITSDVISHLFFWAAIVVVFRELAVTSMRLVVANSSGAVVAASWLGKIKTVTQIIAVCAVMLEPIILPFCHGWVTLLSTITMMFFTIVSGVDYIKTYWKFINTNK